VIASKLEETMFGWGKPKNAPTPAPDPATGGPLIAALLMEGTSFPLDDFRAKVAQSRIRGASPKKITIEKGILVFELGDELVALAPIAAPYPWSDLKGPCATSWMWPRETPATTLEQHRTHVLVTMMRGANSASSGGWR